MESLLIIIIAILAIIAVIMLFNTIAKRRARDRAYAPRDPFSSADDDAVRGDPRTLKPGDMVEIRGEMYAVRGTLTLSQSGFSWTENFIDTGTGRKAWVSVEEDPDLEVVLWEEISGVAVAPGPQTIDVEGRQYTSDETGSARFTSTGTTGLATGNMSYHDYSAGDARLSFEDFGSGWECARGQVLARAEYRIFPADTGPS
jgi:hypothetical protein